MAYCYYANTFSGILGTLTSVLTVYLGVQAGRTLNTYQNVKAKLIRWTAWGFIIVSTCKNQIFLDLNSKSDTSNIFNPYTDLEYSIMK